MGPTKKWYFVPHRRQTRKFMIKPKRSYNQLQLKITDMKECLQVKQYDFSNHIWSYLFVSSLIFSYFIGLDWIRFKLYVI